MVDQAPLYSFTSHISGKNAKVHIFPDRVEWARDKGRSAAAFVASGGLSLLAKRKTDGTEMMPIRAISSVTTKRDGMMNTIVSVIGSGNTVDFRVSHAEAKQIREVLNRLVLNPGTASAPPPPQAAAPDLGAQLQQLASLRDQGVLTEAEFQAKKAEMLSRY